MKKKKKNKKHNKRFSVVRSDFWKPGVGIQCKNCGCSIHNAFDNSKTIMEAIEKFDKLHTKEFCDEMKKEAEFLEKHCPYPCCAEKNKKKNHHGNQKRKSRKIK